MLNPLGLRDPRRAQPTYRFHGTTPPDPARPRQELTASEPKDDGSVTIRLYDIIDSWGGIWGVSAREFAEVLDGLDAGVSTIRVHINSPGGEVWEAVAICNLLRSHPAQIVAVVDGLAASAASLVAVTADETVMGVGTQMMIHDAWGFCMGNAADMHAFGDLLDHLSDNGAAMYMAKAGGTLAQWREAMLAETWYSAQEAVDAGLADRVDGALTDDEGEPQNRFDLKSLGFKYTGREQAPAPGQPSAGAPVQAPPPPVPPVRTGPSLAQRKHAAAAKRHHLPL